jgi:magnesium transporter
MSEIFRKEKIALGSQTGLVYRLKQGLTNMIEKVFDQESPSFHWIDIVEPSVPELEEIAQKYGLHSTSVQDCLDPEHLPKIERIGPLTFMILRGYDDQSVANADTVQELTRKVALFVSDKFVISVHRKDQAYLQNLRERWRSLSGLTQGAVHLRLLTDLVRGVLSSYERPIDRALNQLEECEMQIFGTRPTPFTIQEGYFLKRKASVFKRMLRLSLDVISKLGHLPDSTLPFLQDLREEAESLYFYADELLESMNSLLNLHISLASQKTNEASHRTNEIVRVLTLFSVFFLPLNFIASIYGMNFEYIPELKWPLGYPMVLLVMLAVTVGILGWFRSKGWLK